MKQAGIAAHFCTCLAPFAHFDPKTWKTVAAMKGNEPGPDVRARDGSEPAVNQPADAGRTVKVCSCLSPACGVSCSRPPVFVPLVLFCMCSDFYALPMLTFNMYSTHCTHSLQGNFPVSTRSVVQCPFWVSFVSAGRGPRQPWVPQAARKTPRR